LVERDKTGVGLNIALLKYQNQKRFKKMLC